MFLRGQSLLRFKLRELYESIEDRKFFSFASLARCQTETLFTMSAEAEEIEDPKPAIEEACKYRETVKVEASSGPGRRLCRTLAR
jgi:hypothetical protein